MRVRNESRIPDTTLRPLLDFAAKGTNTADLLVHVIDTTTHFRGWAFGRGSFSKTKYVGDSRWDGRDVQKYPPSVEYLIRLFIPATDARMIGPAFSHVKRIQQLYPNPPQLATAEDAIVFLAAHEFRHIAQYRHRRKGKGEHDAEKWAFAMLAKWYVATDRVPVLPVKQPNPFSPRGTAAPTAAADSAGEWSRRLRD